MNERIDRLEYKNKRGISKNFIVRYSAGYGM